jgi:hypothetical protein
LVSKIARSPQFLAKIGQRGFQPAEQFGAVRFADDQRRRDDAD